jgi:nitrate reductase cytochrome c-type subunit
VKKILLLLFLLVSLEAKYLDTQTCKECHEDIHYEHTHSMHHKSSLFKDEVHAKVKNAVNKDKYSCALCHMPGSSNLRALMKGEEQPDQRDKRQTDGVSCYYCHQIKDVYHSKKYNINISSAKEGEKPTMYANLMDPDDSDKHKAASNEIYKNSKVCMGCHSHKQNGLGFEVCRTQSKEAPQSDCIKCHMPKADGGNEKFNKKGRSEYATHRFLGIHSPEMVKKAVKLDLEYDKDESILSVGITNMMGHYIITHPMRLKFVKTVIKRDGKVIWSNFKKSPIEDKEATFLIVLKNSDDKPTLPNKAVGYKINRNLEAQASKTVRYKVPKLQKGDEVISEWVSYIVNPKVAKKLGITTPEIVNPIIGVEESLYIY